MRKASIPLLILLSLPGLLRAQDAKDAADPSILLLPFAPVSDADKTAWIGQAIQQNLLNELSRVKNVHPLAPADAKLAVADAEGAKKAAATIAAQFVLFGSYQLADGNLRVTGQVMETATGKFAGGIRATGSVRDLFLLEDTLAQQLRRVLAAQVKVEPKPMAAPPQPPVVQQPAPAQPAPAMPPPIVQRLANEPFPWDRDAPFLAHARQRAANAVYYDDDYYRPAAYGYYGGTVINNGGFFWGGFYPSRIGHHHHHHHSRWGATHWFPGGVVRARVSW